MAEFASITDARLEYEERGSGDPVVLIHGALVADAFRPLLRVESLTRRYRLLLYHRRGYAGSSKVAGSLSIERQATDCFDLLNALGLGPAHVVGHSFGGAVALQLTLDFPELVHSLTLIEPALVAGDSGTHYRDSLIQGVDRYRTIGAESIVHPFMEARLPGYRPLLDQMLPGAYDQAVIDASTSFEVDVPGLLDWSFGEADAAHIQQPSLSVLGGESGALSPRFGEVHRLLQDWLPNVEAETLPGAHHFPQIEDPRGLGELLGAFWSRHPLRPG